MATSCDHDSVPEAACTYTCTCTRGAEVMEATMPQLAQLDRPTSNPDAPALVDLRSDTVTRPTERMREAMARAEVGDDVLDRDPTMRALEVRVAETLAVEDALWTPTGCMANLIALMSHLERGDEFLAPADAHVLGAELGTPAWLAGGMPRALPHDAGPGRVTAEAVRRAASEPGGYDEMRTALLCLENTHNAAGGTVTPVAEQREVVAAAHESGLRVHLDGARLWHAAVALGVSPAALTAGVDTVQVCLSKGLGAPVGSVVAGSAAFVARARRLRKMLGGGVRQGGVLAAAGLVALDGIERLAADHDRAARLAAGLADRGWRVSPPETNIVFVDVADASATRRRWEAAGVGVLAIGGRIRMVLHADVTEVDLRAALARIGPAPA
jgi:threonine aldolase